MSEWQLIEAAPVETEILMRAEVDGREVMGRGSISSRERDKPLVYQWHFTSVPPTHWKQIKY
jgi:hypothetical protein